MNNTDISHNLKLFQIFIVKAIVAGFFSFFCYFLISYGPFGLVFNIFIYLIGGIVNGYGSLIAISYIE